MAPLRAVFLVVGMVASASAAVGPVSPVYSVQGGASGMGQEGDYMENKIARGVQGAFGNVADEASKANQHVKDAAKSARQSVRESGRHVKDAAKNARESVSFTSKLGWPFEEKPATPAVDEKPKLSWVGGAKTTVEKEKHAVHKFFGNPNNAFVAQGLVALVFGGLHILKYEDFGARVSEPLCNLVGKKFGTVTAVIPHVRLVGAYLIGVLISDVLAYKSSSAGFKRGKVWHEWGSTTVISVISCNALFTADSPADMLPHAIAAVLFSCWFGFLSRHY